MAKKLALIYLCSDTVLIALCAYFGAVHVLNSQVALISSSLIILASFLGYKKRVTKKISNADISTFDEIFDDDENDENSRIPSKNNENSRIPNQNQQNQKEKTPKIPLRLYEFGSLFSPLRLFGYIVLIIAFFVLLKKELFEPLSFLAGLAIMPLSALFSSIFLKAK